ncbi:MAG: hypothetical protein HY558_05085 [Euryarchaeota archaeon]|nr:hypothetical protein [Euryarchaeota archaeon]
MRLRIEVAGSGGSREAREYDLADDNLSEKHRVLEKALEFLESSLSITRREPLAPPEGGRLPSVTLRESLEGFLRVEFHGGWFTSLQVKRRFEQVHHRVTLSTVSTYLSRMHRDGLLERQGNRRQREYRWAAGPIPQGPPVAAEPKP